MEDRFLRAGRAGPVCVRRFAPCASRSFVIFQSLQEKLRPMKFDDETNPEAAAELEQYAHGKPEEYELQK